MNDKVYAINSMRAYTTRFCPNHFILHLGLAFALFLSVNPLMAQADNAGVDERAMLMQAYMAKRAEWVELREGERKRADAAKNAAQRNAILGQLDQAERALRAEAADLAKRLKDSTKGKLEAAKPRG